MTDQRNTPSAILTAQPAATPAKPAAESKPTASPDTSTAEPRSQWNLSAEQMRSLADFEVNAGRLSREDADAMLAADGVSADSGAPDDFEAARPEHYTFPPADSSEGFTPQQFAADLKMRNWLSTAKFPREIGSSLAAEASQVVRLYAGMDPGQRELYRREQAQLLRQVWGDKFGANVALARQLLMELDSKQPGVLDFVDKSGLGDSASIISMMHQQAERLALRAQKGAK